MRLPPVDAPLDVAIVGVPLDIGTSNRSGARFGPRQIRAESCLLRPYNMATGAAPFDHLTVGDIGDVPLNTFNLAASIDLITEFYDAQRPISDLTARGFPIPCVQPAPCRCRWAATTR